MSALRRVGETVNIYPDIDRQIGMEDCIWHVCVCENTICP